MIKVKEFVEIAKKIASEPTVYYSVAGGDWCRWNGTSWNMDCVCMIKGILWGFNFNKNASHGGAIYGSNGVYDDTADGIINRCTNVSRDFSKIEVGELLHMAGHVGIYIGNGQVVESTAWFGKTIISNIDSNGRRFKDSKNGGYWQDHGKLQYVDYYEPTEQLTPAKSVEELANEVIEGKWANGEDRKIALTNAGYDYNEVQAKVNEILAPKEEQKIDILDLVRKTIRGDFGNGEERKNSLGSNYDEVQRQVDLNYQNGTTDWDNIKLY